MTIIQYILLVIIALLCWRLWHKYHRRAISQLEFIAWLAAWLAAAVLVVRPEVASYLAYLTGVGRGSDLVIYIGLILVFYLIFRIFVRLEKYDRDLSVMVRKMAQRDAESKIDSTEQNSSSAN